MWRKRLSSVHVPWDKNRPSIYSVVETSPPGDDPVDLPDEPLLQEKGLFWAPGALDGVHTHHMEPGEPDVDQIAAAVMRLIETLDKEAFRELYDRVLSMRVISFIDPVLGRLEKVREGRHWTRIAELGRLLMKQAPDREAVKLGISLTGLTFETTDLPALVTLGRHDEFTLYVSVALARSPSAEDEIWSLAKSVHGWGRIFAVERLSRTRRPAIRKWLLREGFRNSVMNEYLAWTAATTGGLADELKNPQPDDALILGAGEILCALIADGPGRDMGDYEEGAEATELYLGHLETYSMTLSEYQVLEALCRYLSDGANEGVQTAAGWTPAQRTRMLEQIRILMARADWPTKAEAALNAEDGHTFWQARPIAESLGIDTWEQSFKRHLGGEDQWYFLMRTPDRNRIDRVLDLASKSIDLAGIATGPAEELGLGSAFEEHRVLDWIVPGLAGFPGVGWPFVEAALQSPVTRNRNIALRTLEAWGRSNWRPGTEAMVRKSLVQEPSDQVRRSMQALLDGVPLETGVHHRSE